MPKNEYGGISLFNILSQQTIVKKVRWVENKSTNLFEEYSKRKLICVCTDSVQSHIILLKKLENNSRIKQVFNTDLSHVWQYLFHKLNIEPTSKVEVEYHGSKLVKLTKVDDEEDIPPPPFSILRISVHTLSGNVNPEDPVMMIKSRYEDASNQEQTADALFESKEEKKYP